MTPTFIPFVASRFRSDGGAMYGLVPKSIWQKMTQADENNTIGQVANSCLITLADGRRGIIDTGCGDSSWYSAAQRTQKGIPDEWPLMEALSSFDIEPDALDFVVLTHAHWDHVGGLCDPDGNPVFPNAEIFLHAEEHRLLVSGDPVLGAAYPPTTRANVEGVGEQLTLVDGDATEILPGLVLRRSGGHTHGHCVVHLHQFETETHGLVKEAIHTADACPSQHHLRPQFQTAYDTHPLDMRAWKLEWLPRAAEEGILMLWGHDANSYGSWLSINDRGHLKIDRHWGEG